MSDDRIAMQSRLSAMELVALTLAYYADVDNEIAWKIPEPVWDGLFDRRYLRTSRDVADEYQTVTTQAGYDALLAAFKEEADRVPA